MKQLFYSHWKKSLLTFILLAYLPIFAQETVTFDYTGDVQTYVVPDGITSIQIECFGAQGQAITVDDFEPFSLGGMGGYAVGNLTVTPGETLNIYVGGEGGDGVGGYNGGGVAGFGTGSTHSSGYAGSGGGASDVRQGGATLADRVIVAGGGGGGGRNYTNGGCVPCGTGGDGGAGGGTTGVDGSDPGGGVYDHFNDGAGGNGGTAVAGGAGGDGTEGLTGNPGELGIGGDGIDGTQGVASGGGGGGYYGGGAGGGADWGTGAAGGGGGGGSSYVGGVTDGSTVAGERAGNGQIIITELCTPLTVSVSSEEICAGTELTLTASSELGGSVEWDGGAVPNGDAFIPAETGEVTFTAESDAEGDCIFEATVTIHALPEVTGEVDDLDICMGDSVVFTAGGTADTYEWSDGIVDGEFYTPEDFGDMEFKVYGTDDATGCMDSAAVYVFVYELPAVVATSDEDTYCDGDMITLMGEGADSYEWDMGVEDGVAFTQAIGTETYTVTGTSIDGCIASDEIEVTVNPNPTVTVTGTDELLGSDGTLDITVTGGTSPYLYDWDNDGTGDFDDAGDQTGLVAGTYTIVVMDDNGCTATAEYTINSQLGINANEVDGLTVYPNPTIGELTIVKSGYFTYELISLSGQVMLDGDGTDQDVMDVETLSNGVYLLKLTIGDDVQTLKVVKQ